MFFPEFIRIWISSHFLVFDLPSSFGWSLAKKSLADLFHALAFIEFISYFCFLSILSLHGLDPIPSRVRASSTPRQL